ncbi:DinB family protein [Deinococcus sp.]|uniref:DinB family protein n=1 Tax=Deinococcus sp. TaxID=47478 RepID=UPI0025E579A0|nr:DinB family protein [Deinococcus sp.]
MTSAEPTSPNAWLRAFGAAPAEVAERLERELAAFSETARRAQPDWHRPLPERTWTPAQESEHVLLVAESTVKIVRLLLSDSSLRETPRVLIGTDEQGRRQAPAGTEPGPDQPWNALAGRYSALTPALRGLALSVPEPLAPLEPARMFWHPALGDLDALDWLRTAAFHTRHHRHSLQAGLDALKASA